MPRSPEPSRPGAPPLFSVLIATFNQAAYIEATLDSVAGQDETDFEIVVVNDGSTDDTEARVRAWARRFVSVPGRRLVLETTANAGQSAAFEHGAGICAGRYVCLLDSDDRWLPGKLAAVRRAVEADPGAGMIVHPLHVIGPDGERTGDVRPKHARLSHGDLRAEVRRTGRQVAPATSGIVLRADVLRALLPMPTRAFRSAADAYLSFGATLLAPVHALDEPLAEYRMHADGWYLRRMLSAEGLRTSVELQRTIARHFGLERTVRRNAYFARNAFALAKLSEGPAAQLLGYAALARATVADHAFTLARRAALLAFWTVALLAPRRVFQALWRAFQWKQTGYDRVARASQRSPTPPPGAEAAPNAVQVLGVRVHPMTRSELLGILRAEVRRGEPTVIGNHNLHSSALVRSDPAMRRFYADARYTYVDGMPLIWAGRLQGHRLRRDQRITSIDWLRPALRMAAAEGWRVFLLGSTPAVVEHAAGRLRDEVPGLQMDWHHGHFDPTPGGAENDAVLARIERFRPHLLLVGMGMPRQEHWITANRPRLAVPVTLNLGAFLDYVAGAQPTPPRWTGALGLEWLARLAADPRRLWRRYLVEPLPLLPVLLRDCIRARAGRQTPSLQR